MQKNNSALFFTCSLIEYIARSTNNKRCDVVDYLKNDIQRIYEYADVFHCEPIQKVTDDFVEKVGIKQGEYDNISNCKYTVPDYWDIGEVFERLIEDCYEEENVIKGIQEVYHSWLCEKIMNFNSDLYYQSRDYIAECYKEGKVLE
ncbi:MAG: hypothetical protein IJN64_18980 [Lachnospiraceae bacterium]|nr:hypothetical protein [Lachnospiraceae bacterium]